MIFRCTVCNSPVEEYSLVTGIAKPCGHCQLDKKTIRKNKKLLNGINEIASKGMRK